MSKPRKHAAETRPVSMPSHQKRLVGLLIVLVIILPLLSWKIASNASFVRSSRLEPGKVYFSNPGPWGNLEYVRIALELPDHFVNVDEVDVARWSFRGWTQEEVLSFFKKSGVDDKQFELLEKTATWENTPEGCRLLPKDDFIWSLSSQSRSEIYGHLAQFEENVDQYYAFRYRSELLAERFEASGLKKETIELFHKLLYPSGSLVRFSDTDAVLRKLSDKQERLRFVKTVTRRSSLLVRLNLDPKADIEGLLAYWGIGGRAKDLRPLVESLTRVQEGCKIDLAHFLPPFARQRIYTFPMPSNSEPALRQDCHWTSLNFFNDKPTEGYANPEDVIKKFETEFDPIGTGTTTARFGDVVFLKLVDGTIIHSAVYIADDIVFTKNGAGENQPWLYMRMEDMLLYYSIPKETIQVVTYRRKHA